MGGGNAAAGKGIRIWYPSWSPLQRSSTSLKPLRANSLQVVVFCLHIPLFLLATDERSH